MNSPVLRTQEHPEEDVFEKTSSLCLKGIAILMMLVHHCFLSKKRYKGFDIRFVIPESKWLYAAGFFKICVALFVFVSAYGITKKLMTIPQEGSRRKYYGLIGNVVISRLVRLLSAFMFVLLLVDLFALVYDPGFLARRYGTSFFSALQYWLIDMLGLAELFQTPTLQGAYWYYSLAIVLIILVPVFYLMLRKLGPVLFLGLIAALNFTLSFQNSNIKNYILAIAVGVVCAGENLITRLVRYHFFQNERANRIFKFFAELILLLGLMTLFMGVLKLILRPLWNAAISPLLAVFCCEFVLKLPPIRRFLSFCGKHSGNIFLVHSYIRNVWGKNFTYGFRYPLLIVAALFTASLAVSLVIEALKKLVRFKPLVNRLERTLTAWNLRTFGEREE